MQFLTGLPTLFIGGACTRDLYVDVLRLPYELFVNVKKHGFIVPERDVSSRRSPPGIPRSSRVRLRAHQGLFNEPALSPPSMLRARVDR